jgi:DNA polymerase sigma
MGVRYNYQNFDIAIFHRHHQNKQYVAYIGDGLIHYPVIRPLYFLIKNILQTFNLHDPLSGGLKTYGLFLMILHVVKINPNKCIAELLSDISLFYGFYYEYNYDLK